MLSKREIDDNPCVECDKRHITAEYWGCKFYQKCTERKIYDAKNRRCNRCGSTENIESHHKVHKFDGGSDDKSNRIDKCRACHKYEHARDGILRQIALYVDRIQQLRLRLKTLESMNGVNEIRQYGYRNWDLEKLQAIRKKP